MFTLVSYMNTYCIFKVAICPLFEELLHCLLKSQPYPFYWCSKQIKHFWKTIYGLPIIINHTAQKNQRKNSNLKKHLM